jgi:uncharacterized membrane protein YphA (DoxX/SURF4 family)
VLRRQISAAKQFSAKHEVDNELYFGLPLDDKTKGFRIATLTRSRIFACSDFRMQKIGWYWSALHAGKSFSSIGLAPLIAKMGFPIPVALALWITFNESIGAFLIGCGFLTRVLSASLALGIAGALYVSVRLSEDWLRAALYLIIFITLILTGPGEFSLDHLLFRNKSGGES